MNLLRRSLLATGAMAACAAVARGMTPTIKLATAQGPLALEQAVPLRFADWRVDDRLSGGIVNPQQEATLKRLYSQLLSRTYLNSAGERVMLSVAYGEDQRDQLEAHYPEVCYPAQGFRVVSNRRDSVHTARGDIVARRLETVYNAQRYEPVTYWMMIGDTAHVGGIDKRLAEVAIGLKGYIADGLLFRVSSLGTDSRSQFALQDRFIDQLLAELPERSLKRISGLPNGKRA